MSVLSEIAAKLQDLGLGTVGTDIHIGRMPESGPASSSGTVCAVYEFAGIPSDLGFSVSGIQYETPGVQVVFRGYPNIYSVPRAAAATAHNGLAAVQATTLSGTRYLLIRPQGSPEQFKRDANERPYIAVSFLATKVPS